MLTAGAAGAVRTSHVSAAAKRDAESCCAGNNSPPCTSASALTPSCPRRTGATYNCGDGKPLIDKLRCTWPQATSRSCQPRTFTTTSRRWRAANRSPVTDSPLRTGPARAHSPGAADTTPTASTGPNGQTHSQQHRAGASPAENIRSIRAPPSVNTASYGSWRLAGRRGATAGA